MCDCPIAGRGGLAATQSQGLRSEDGKYPQGADRQPCGWSQQGGSMGVGGQEGSERDDGVGSRENCNWFALSKTGSIAGF